VDEPIGRVKGSSHVRRRKHRRPLRRLGLGQGCDEDDIYEHVGGDRRLVPCVARDPLASGRQRRLSMARAPRVSGIDATRHK
jgi:hypothetical protein